MPQTVASRLIFFIFWGEIRVVVKKWTLRKMIFFLFIYLFSACRKQDRNSYHSKAESADTSPAFF